MDEFDPTLAGYSDEEKVEPKKRQAPALPEPLQKQAKLPSAKALLSNKEPPAFLSSIPLRKPDKYQQVDSTSSQPSAVIEKPAVMNPAVHDPMEQYDYFASNPDANLSLWQSPQDLPDPERAWDKNKLIKKIDTRRVAVLGLEGKREKYEKKKVKKWEVPLPKTKG